MLNLHEFSTRESFDSVKSGLGEESFVLIKATQEIYHNGVFYSIPEEYKNKITTLEEAVELLKNGTVKQVTGELAIAVTEGQTPQVSLKIDENPGNVDLTQTESGLKANFKVKSADKTVTTTLGSDGTDLSVNIDNESIIKEDGVIKVKLEALTQYTGKEAIKVEGDTATKTVELLISSLNKILSQSSDGLLATLKFKDDKENKKIQLLGVDDEVVTDFDYAKFIVDGMIETVKLEGDILTFTFNTDAGKEAIPIDLSKYITIYTAGDGIDITSNKVTAVVKVDDKYIEVTSNGISSKGIDEAITAAVLEETNRAKDAEEINARNITAEVERAKGAEKANADKIQALEEKMGEDSVQDQIAEAIEALDVTNIGGTGKYIQVVGQSDGKVTATAQDLNAIAVAITAIEGLTTTNNNVQEALVALDVKLEDINKKIHQGYYSINFIQGTVAQEFTTEIDCEILSFMLENISLVKVVINSEKQDLKKGLVLPANTLVTWEITKTSEDVPAVIGIKYQEVYEN